MIVSFSLRDEGIVEYVIRKEETNRKQFAFG